MTPLLMDLAWEIPPQLTFLNHGSFGLAPRPLLDWRVKLLRRMECDPVAFLTEELPQQLQVSRQVLAQLVRGRAEQLAFVPSTTYGLNELMQRLELLEPDWPTDTEILLSNHGYNATHNLVSFAAQRLGWRVRTVPLPSPLEDPAQVVEAFAAAWTPSTRLLVVDHITSPSALLFPLGSLLALARRRGARLVVDGAHGPGLVELDLEALQADAYVGNLHKWLCCPRGAAFVWVSRRWRERLRPLVVSHGANQPLGPAQSRFQLEHDWIGTADPSPWLALPVALKLLGRQRQRQREALRRPHAALVAAGSGRIRGVLEELGLRCGPPPLGFDPLAMGAVSLPPVGRLDGVALQRGLKQRGIQVPVIPLGSGAPGSPQFLRISWFDYNREQDLDRLEEGLRAQLAGFAAGSA